MILTNIQDVIKRLMKYNYPTWKKIKYFTTRHRTNNLSMFLRTIELLPLFYHKPLCNIICIAINIYVQNHDDLDIQGLKKLIGIYSFKIVFTQFFSNLLPESKHVVL
jgi:hypothetical protein